MKHKRPTQAKRVLNYIKENGGITAFDAVTDLGCLRLSARIFELRESGIEIKSQFIEVENRFGEICRVKLYWI